MQRPAGVTAARPVAVTLTDSEVQLATFEAARRGMDALQSGHRQKFGAAPGPNGYIDALGCCGELAVCKYLGLFWSGIGSHKVDVGGSLQVRTADQHTKKLIVRPCDADSQAFVLVTVGGRPMSVWIRGWMLAIDAKQPAYLLAAAGREAAYFVPAEDLHPIQTLRLADQRTEIR